MEFRPVADREFERAQGLDEEYLGSPRHKLGEWRAARPNWFRGAYHNAKLIGICYGNEGEPGTVVLRGIAVVFEHWRKGIGSRLIRDFEKTVFAEGVTRISLGSASDWPTESFYLKHRYRATQIMLRAADLRARNDSAGPLPEPDRIVDDGETLRLYFAVDSYAPKLRDELQRAYAVDEAIFIFEKTRADYESAAA